MAVTDDGVSPDEVRQQLDRILRSGVFKRSRRSQQFLSFITRIAIAGQQSTINEHMIGIEVFDRGPNYNPGEDGVVRRQAHSLRHRLETYYKTEGQHDSVLIEVPVGHYVPVFGRRDIEADESTTESAPIAPTQRGLPIWGWLALVVLVAAVAFLAGRNLGRDRSTAASTSLSASELRELWGAWLSSPQEPVICFSSPYGAVVKHLATPLPVDSQPPRLRLSGELEGAFRAELGIGEAGFLYVSPSINEAKSGEAQGGSLLANFFGMNGLRTRATLSRLLTWDDFREQNLILLGHSEQNRWVAPLLEEYPLQLLETSGGQKRRVVNARPGPGEMEYFEIDYAAHEDEATVEYGLVSMLPGTDRQHQLLIVSGLNTQATLMGIEFLTDPVRVRDLLGRMRALSPGHSGPWHFQLVLKTQVREKLPTGASIEMIRVLDPPAPSPTNSR